MRVGIPVGILSLIAANPAWATTETGDKPVQGSLLLILIVAGVAVVFAVVLGTYSDLLRGKDPVSLGLTAKTKNYRRPFSLAQSQMMWWFGIIIASFIYIAIVRLRVENILSEQALILMGIGTGTALGATLVDQTRSADSPSSKKYKEFEDLAEQIRQTAPGPALAALTKSYDALADELKSENFFADILSDVGGVSLHRFQSVAWTAVLGVFFVIGVLNQAIMPEFDKYLLAVLGISGATYIGFKISEQPV